MIHRIIAMQLLTGLGSGATGYVRINKRGANPQWSAPQTQYLSYGISYKKMFLIVKANISEHPPVIVTDIQCVRILSADVCEPLSVQNLDEFLHKFPISVVFRYEFVVKVPNAARFPLDFIEVPFGKLVVQPVRKFEGFVVSLHPADDIPFGGFRKLYRCRYGHNFQLFFNDANLEKFFEKIKKNN